MKTQNHKCVILAILVMLTSINILQAQDERKITFTVPVEFRNVHENVRGLTFECDILNAGGERVGGGMSGVDKTQLDSDGNFTGEVTINARAEGGKEITDAVRYTITMYCDGFYTSEDGGNIDFFEEPSYRNFLPAEAKQGTELITELRGDIVW